MRGSGGDGVVDWRGGGFRVRELFSNHWNQLNGRDDRCDRLSAQGGDGGGWDKGMG